MNWNVKTFSELDAITFFKIAKARIDIFVVEQMCPYPELDDIDIKDTTQHIFSLNEHEELMMYARCYPNEFDGVSIGRVIVTERFRGNGHGNLLMKMCLDVCEKTWQGTKIRVSAQSHLQKFYMELGFKVISEVYLEDDIPHIDMELIK